MKWNSIPLQLVFRKTVIVLVGTWRSGAELGCARSQADNHGLIRARVPVSSSPAAVAKPPCRGPLSWLVPRRAPEINASAITTSPGPGRILTSGSAALAWCRPAWDALATPDDFWARAHGPIITRVLVCGLRCVVRCGLSVAAAPPQCNRRFRSDVVDLILHLFYYCCPWNLRPSWAHKHTHAQSQSPAPQHTHSLSMFPKKIVFGKIFTSHTLTNAGAQNRDDDEIAMGSTFPQGWAH